MRALHKKSALIVLTFSFLVIAHPVFAEDSAQRYEHDIEIAKINTKDAPTVNQNLSAGTTAINRTDIDSPIIRKVLVIDFNPILESKNNQRLRTYKNWYDPIQLEQQYVQTLYQVSSGIVNYQIVERLANIDQIPIKQDGFQYTDSTYLNAIDGGGGLEHRPDLANYLSILNQYNVCSRVNSGEIDELWLWGGPWFGYWEQTYAGPESMIGNLAKTHKDAMSQTTSVIHNTNCQKILPIMGFAYHLGVEYMVHDLGHRAEALLTSRFGNWLANTNTPWNEFTLLESESPSNSRCGYVHFPPNSTEAYGYSDQLVVRSKCVDWWNYPVLTNTSENISCSSWSCDHGKYLQWWLSHLPKYRGQTEGKWNNWWKYILLNENSQLSFFESFESYAQGQTIPGWASNDLTTGSPVAIDGNSFPSPGTEGSNYMKIAMHNDGSGTFDPYATTPWIETANNVTNRTFEISFKVRNHQPSNLTITGLLLQRYPKNGNDWTSTNVNLQSVIAESTWSNKVMYATFNNPSNGSTTSQLRLVLRPDSSSEWPVYYDAIMIREVTAIPTQTPTPSATPNPTITAIPNPGDTNGDNKVDIYDYNRILQFFDQTLINNADLSVDGRVDIFDYNTVLQYFGS